MFSRLLVALLESTEMSLLRKQITVQFFYLTADDNVVRKFVSTFKSIRTLAGGADVVTLAQSRYVISCIPPQKAPIGNCLSWSTVKERNTWQVRSKQDGSIASLQGSNSLVGDVSYFRFDPDLRILAAFTAYPATGYLKTMACSVFHRLLPQAATFSLDYLSDDAGISQVKKWDYYSKISITLDPAGIPENDDKPELIKALLSIKDVFGGNTISVTLDGGKNKLPKQDVTETINYLSSSDSCRSLYLAGGMFEGDEKLIPINLKKAFIKHRTAIDLRVDEKHISIERGSAILSEAFAQTRFPSLPM